MPSFAAFAQLLDAHGVRPGADRLLLAGATVFNYVIGNADAHAKNFSLLHEPGGVRMAPLYDLVSTAVYPEVSQALALAIGDAHDAAAVGYTEWTDFAGDLGLRAGFFARWRARLASRVRDAARAVCADARGEGWHAPVLDDVVQVIEKRAERVDRSVSDA